MATGIGTQTIKSSYDQLLITENTSGLQKASYTQIHSGDGTISSPLWLHQGSVRIFTEDGDGLNIFKVMAEPAIFDGSATPVFRVDAGKSVKGVYIENCNLDLTSTAAKVSLGSGTTGNGYGYMLRGDNNVKLSWQTFQDAQGSYITFGDTTSNIYATTLSLSTIADGEATFAVDKIVHNQDSSKIIDIQDASFDSDGEGNTLFTTNALSSATLTVSGASSLNATSFNEENITNVGDIDADSISIDGATTGLAIDGTGADSGTFNIIMQDSRADALSINDGDEDYIVFNTTPDSERITFSQGSTFAGTTIVDLGTVTTADINAGSIDNMTVGAAVQNTGSFTTLAASGAATLTSTLAVSGLLSANGGIACDTDKFTVADTTGNTVIDGTLAVGGTLGVTGVTTLAALIADSGDFSNNNITNVGDIDLDSISIADAGSGLMIDGSEANSTTFKVMLRDEMADALNILEDTNSYMKFITTGDGSITFGVNATFAGKTIADLGTVETADIDGGTINDCVIENCTIGVANEEVGTFSSLVSNSLISKATDGDLTLSGNGDGIVKVNDKLDSTGDITADKIGVGGLDEDDTLSAEIEVGDITNEDPEILIKWRSNTPATSGRLTFERDENPGEDDDTAGQIYFKASSAGSTQRTVAKIETLLETAADGTEDGQIVFSTITHGSSKSILSLTGAESASLVAIGSGSHSANTTMTGTLDITSTLGVAGIGTFSTHIVAGGDIKIAATNKLYLDGGTDTYLYASASNELKFKTETEEIVLIRGDNSIYDTVYGNSVAQNIVSGLTENVFIGYLSAGTGTLLNAVYNTAVGSRTLENITEATSNCAFGMRAQNSNISADNNSAFGYYSLEANETGEQNTSIGSRSLLNNTSGGDNVAIGYNAGEHSTAGADVTALNQ